MKDDETKIMKGHFEKVVGIKNDWFFVNQKDASGMPGAYVIADNNVGI